MKALLAAAVGVVAMAVSWFFGGPFGGVLNAPGLLILGGARALEILPRFEERGLSRWLWVGTLLSGLCWALLTYAITRFTGRKRRPAA